MTQVPTITDMVSSDLTVVNCQDYLLVDGNSLEERLTDVGNANLLVTLFSDQIHYVSKVGWKRWDGTRWKDGANEEMMRAAIITTEKLHEIAKEQRDPKINMLISRWSKNSQSNTRLKAMIEIAKSVSSITVDPSQFDADAMLLNVENGTLDLRNGRLRKHNSSDMITHVAGTHYDPDADCPNWYGFLEKVTDGNQDVKDYLQRAVGYTLTGLNREQCLFFMYGDGQNGKSTFANTIYTMLGSYAAKTPTETLMRKHYSSIPNDIARLVGSRYVLAAELDRGKYLNETLVKDLTGGDPISARFLHKEYFEFLPIFKIWMYGNHMPNIESTDEGIWRRVRIIPFDIHISEEERDKAFGEKLANELPGILIWAVNGCLEWQKQGLGLPLKVKEATLSLREEMDQVSRFIDEMCDINPEGKIKLDQLHRAYMDWCRDSGEQFKTKIMFGKRVMKLGYRKDTSTNKQWFWFGLDLKETEVS